MSNHNLRSLYKKFSTALAYIAVEQNDGTQSIGSAFHVGDGVFVTARHVVEGNNILEVSTATSSFIPLSDEDTETPSCTVFNGEESFRAHRISPQVLAISKGPLFHEDPDIDIAVFKVSNLDKHTPHIPLGDHLDDWLGKDDFLLTDVLILGFPPVPFSNEPRLIGARGEVNALMDFRHVRHVHFIVSAMPRGGFSGGVAITSDGVALGVITQSVVMNGMPEQLGYMAVLSVEPIYECLAQNKLLPAPQTEIWGDFWNSNTSWFSKGISQGQYERLSVSTLDDGRSLALSIYSTSQLDREAVVAAVRAHSDLVLLSEETTDETTTFNFQLIEDKPDPLANIETKAIEVAAQIGYMDQNEYLLANSPDLPF